MKVWVFDGDQRVPSLRADARSDHLVLKRDDGTRRQVWIGDEPPGRPASESEAPNQMRIATRSAWRSDAQPPLYARWVAGFYAPTRVLEACAISHAILGDVSRQRGFVAVYMAVDPETGETFSVSIWDSRADADANVESGWFRTQVARFAGIYVDPPTREDFTLVEASRGADLGLVPARP